MLTSKYERAFPLKREHIHGDTVKGIATLNAVTEQGEICKIVKHLEFADKCIDFMKLVTSTDQRYAQTCVDRRGRTSKQVTKLGKHAGSLRFYAKLYSPGQSYHPALRFFLDHYRAHPICLCEVDAAVPRSVEVFDDFVQGLRDEAARIGLKKKIRNWESKYKKNYQRLIYVEKTLFEMCSRLAVIRLDLEYDKSRPDQKAMDLFFLRHQAEQDQNLEAYLNGADLDAPSQTEGLVSLEELQRDRDRLLANMKGKSTLFEHLITYAWRIECTPQAGYHLHLLLFFDGSQVRKHEHLAHEIGEYWSEVVTEGRGRFHNVNRAWRPEHPRYGIGLISWDDALKRENLRRYVLAYLSKSEQKVCVMPYRGWNAFGTSTLRQRPPTDRGRPRIGTKSASVLDVQWVPKRNFRHPRLSSAGADNHLAKVRV